MHLHIKYHFLLKLYAFKYNLLHLLKIVVKAYKHVIIS